MDKNQKNEIKVGIVSIIGLAILISVIIFAKGFSFSEKTTPVLFIFDNSAGITNGSPVVVNGVKRGIVEKIWTKNRQVFIQTNLNDISDLRSDVSAVITMLELMGGKKIEIFQGNSDEIYNPENPIYGESSTDLPTILRKVGDVTDNLTSIAGKLDTLLISTNSIISDKKFIGKLQEIVTNTALATNELNEILNKNDKNIELSVENVAQISSDLQLLLSENKSQIDKIVDNLEVSSDELNNILAKADTTFLSANKLITNLNEIVENVKSDNGGAISKLIYDEEFAKKLDTLVESFDGLAKQILEYGINTNVKLGHEP
jgi:phospholipid/cholesterol/gamma-HCH transport system substrate-binding protein